MEVVLYIAASIALLALASLFIYLIIFIKSTGGLIDQVTKSVNTLVEEIKVIRLSLNGTIQNLQAITGKLEGTVEQLNGSVERVNGLLNQVEGIVGNVRQVTEDASRIITDGTDVVHAAKGVVMSVIAFEQDIQLKVQQPISETMTIFSALGKGIRAFRGRLAGAPGNGHIKTDVYYK